MYNKTCRYFFYKFMLHIYMEFEISQQYQCLLMQAVICPCGKSFYGKSFYASSNEQFLPQTDICIYTYIHTPIRIYRQTPTEKYTHTHIQSDLSLLENARCSKVSCWLSIGSLEIILAHLSFYSWNPWHDLGFLYATYTGYWTYIDLVYSIKELGWK